MPKIIFNAQFRNTRTRISSISGRLGNFIFRTNTKTGQISAFYQPKRPEFIEPTSDQSRTILESLSDQLREITDYLGLIITQSNFEIR